MDARSQHERFRRIHQNLVENRKRSDPEFAATDWLTRCFDSLSVFVSEYPDRQACERELDRMEAEFAEIDNALDGVVSQIRENGMTYAEIEDLRYHLPSPVEKRGLVEGETE